MDNWTAINKLAPGWVGHEKRYNNGKTSFDTYIQRFKKPNGKTFYRVRDDIGSTEARNFNSLQEATNYIDKTYQLINLVSFLGIMTDIKNNYRVGAMG